MTQHKITLVEIHPSAGVALEPRYASDNNICNQPLYKQARLWLHPQAAAQLQQAAQSAQKYGLQLWLWDAYRPKTAQQALWNACPDPQYVANPNTGGSLHTRGVAVDLTLARKSQLLDCGTDFDHMSPTAHWNAYEAGLISAAQQENRLRLHGLMQDAGFETIATEWWHWQLPGTWPLLPNTVGL